MEALCATDNREKGKESRQKEVGKGIISSHKKERIKMCLKQRCSVK